MNTPSTTAPPPDLGFDHASEDDAIVLTPRGPANGRTVLFIGFVGGPGLFESWLISRFGGHHLWGCTELAERGYRVVMPRIPRARSSLVRHLQMDLSATLRHARRLRSQDIIYCNHNVLLWSPLLAKLSLVKARIVGLLYAREPLPLTGSYTGIIAMTSAAMRHAAALNRRAKLAHIPWAVELTDHYHAYQPYDPRWGLSCGVTGRDFDVIRQAYQTLSTPLKIVARGLPMDRMPPNVQRPEGFISPEELVHELYRQAAYVLVTLKRDSVQREAVGCTNVLEAMALGRPIIKTRTGALDEDLDIEAEGVGLYVPPEDPAALAQAVTRLIEDPQAAEEMGRRGRALCEHRYDMSRFGDDLAGFFASLS